MAATYQVTPGCDWARSFTAYDDAGGAVSTLLDTDSLAGVVWPGGSQAALFSPAVAFLDAAAGTFSVAMTGAQTASLAAGTYRLKTTVSRGGITAPLVEFSILVSAAPGAATYPVYGTLEDLEALAGDWIDDLVASDDGPGDFLRERSKARKWIDNQVMARIGRDLEDQARRHGPVVCIDPIVPADGVDAGPFWGNSTIPDTTMLAQLRAFRAALTAGALMNDDDLDGGKANQACANWALAQICGSQVGKDAESPYQKLAPGFRKDARAILAGWTAYLDTDGDGNPEFEIKP